MRLSFYSGLALTMIAASDTAKASERDYDEHHHLSQVSARELKEWNQLAQSDSLSDVPSTMGSDGGADNTGEANSDVNVDTGSEVTTENESEVDLDTASEAEVSTDTELLNETNNEADAMAEAQAFADIGAHTETTAETEAEADKKIVKKMKPKKSPRRSLQRKQRKRGLPSPATPRSSASPAGRRRLPLRRSGAPTWPRSGPLPG